MDTYGDGTVDITTGCAYIRLELQLGAKAPARKDGDLICHLIPENAFLGLVYHIDLRCPSRIELIQDELTL